MTPRRLPHLAFLVLVWMLLWGEATAANFLSGVLVGGGLLLAFPPKGAGSSLVLRPLQTLRFVVYFLFKLVESNVVVAWEVLSPGDDIHEGIIAVPITGASDGVVTLIAYATTLTPGTLTLEVARDPTTLYMHVMPLRSVEATRRDVLNLERLALAAFGTSAEIESARAVRRALQGRTAGRRQEQGEV